MSEINGNSAKKLGLLLAAVVGFVILLVTVVESIGGKVELSNEKIDEILRDVMILVLIALFMERALEVFMTIWRGGTADELQIKVDATRRALEVAGAADVTTANSALKDAEAELGTHKDGSRKKAFVSSTILGLLISYLGVRSLALVVEYGNMHGFTALDIILTGLLLGGGADGLHKIVSVFTAYADATKTKVKKNAAKN